MQLKNLSRSMKLGLDNIFSDDEMFLFYSPPGRLLSKVFLSV